MHLLKGRGGQEKPPAASAGSRATTMRTTAADPDDVEDILKHVRRGVEAISLSQGEQGKSYPSDESASKVSSQSMTRCQSDATVAMSSQEEAPIAVPKASVRGRYVFSGGGGSEMIVGQPGLRPGQHMDFTASDPSGLQMSPRPGGIGRPTDFSNRRVPRTRGESSGAVGAVSASPPAAHAAEAAMAAECVEADEIGNDIG
eukprot:TRINITY_DN49242_c0_g1_i1.p1 TRINITY_DN49242_c0_g1~~TRINITY_DN49242_c0_g1_i1.p1  ORF type:complete len:201 (+),score=31.53 TRINITY_DN49242_c0_g1_i1:103-705(+)